MGDFKEHGLLLYLSPDLYVAFIRLQGDRGLGRSYAGLLPFTEGLYRLGYLSKKAYEEHVKKYSQGLAEKQPSLVELKEEEEIRRLERHYAEVLKQWSQLSDHVRAVHREKAKECASKVKNARLVLELDSELIAHE